jgi:formylglycine-generating enzyme required for sulfatase activity
METEAGRLPPGWEYGSPTEAQWEYACRAGTTTAYSFGDDEGKLGDYAWYRDNSERKTHPVGEKLENAWGLCDMHGNVIEWCADSYGEYATEPVTDPSGPTTGSVRVRRGGSWNLRAGFCRSANRFRFSPDDGIVFLGFRVAAVPSSQGPEAEEPESGAERDSR